MWYGDIPGDRKTSDWRDYWDERAWMIQGEPCGEQPRGPVVVPPIDELLGRKVFSRGAIIPGISTEEFELIRREAIGQQATR